ncbi:MAG: acyl-CoA thioesterase [Candidatus Hydrogenedentes bacterium]|nr:acyl-CoA thioesterase [Candidatus Hydrogenedentota bacterium]
MERDGFKVWTTVSVRWGDMDALGHVNNSVYFTYLESARIRLFEILGAAGFWSQEGTGPTLASVGCNFRQQVVYPCELDIGTRVVHIGNKSFHLEHAFFLHGTETFVADGKSVVVWVDYSQKRGTELTEGMRKALEEFV